MQNIISTLAGTGSTVLLLSGNFLMEVAEGSIKNFKGFKEEKFSIKAVIKSSADVRLSAKDLWAAKLEVPLIKVSDWGKVVKHSPRKIKMVQRALNIKE